MEKLVGSNAKNLSHEGTSSIPSRRNGKRNKFTERIVHDKTALSVWLATHFSI